MFILQKKNNSLYSLKNLFFKAIYLFVVLVFLNSCSYIFPLEPVSKVNDEFMFRYGTEINRAKRKHYRELEIGLKEEAKREPETAYGRMLRDQLDFIESNAKNNPYKTINTLTNEYTTEYLAYNAKPVFTREDIFEEMNIPEYDFQHYNLGKKEFNEISNIELQEAYDFMYLINQEKIRLMQLNEIRSQQVKSDESKSTISTTTNIIEETKKNIETLTNRLRDVVNDKLKNTKYKF